jgi:thiazole synthase
MWDDPLTIGGRTFRSRLIVGTGKFSSFEVMRRCHQASGAELATVAVRSVDLSRGGESLLDFVDPSRITLVTATTGCRSAEEAVRTAYLGREAGLGDLVALEVTGDERTEWPDAASVLEATRTLVREGVVVLASPGPDPVAAHRAEDAGAAALLIQGAPRGSGLGVRNLHAVRIILERAIVPVIVAGGIGTASDAALALELGCHGVGVTTAIAEASDPEAMAEAMRLGVEAGRAAHRAGRVSRKLHASWYGVYDGLA